MRHFAFILSAALMAAPSFAANSSSKLDKARRAPSESTLPTIYYFFSYEKASKQESSLIDRNLRVLGELAKTGKVRIAAVTPDSENEPMKGSSQTLSDRIPYSGVNFWVWTESHTRGPNPVNAIVIDDDIQKLDALKTKLDAKDQKVMDDVNDFIRDATSDRNGFRVEGSPVLSHEADHILVVVPGEETKEIKEELERLRKEHPQAAISIVASRPEKLSLKIPLQAEIISASPTQLRELVEKLVKAHIAEKPRDRNEPSVIYLGKRHHDLFSAMDTLAEAALELEDPDSEDAVTLGDGGDLEMTSDSAGPIHPDPPTFIPVAADAKSALAAINETISNMTDDSWQSRLTATSGFCRWGVEHFASGQTWANPVPTVEDLDATIARVDALAADSDTPDASLSQVLDDLTYARERLDAKLSGRVLADWAQDEESRGVAFFNPDGSQAFAWRLYTPNDDISVPRSYTIPLAAETSQNILASIDASAHLDPQAESPPDPAILGLNPPQLVRDEIAEKWKTSQGREEVTEVFERVLRMNRAANASFMTLNPLARDPVTPESERDADAESAPRPTWPYDPRNSGQSPDLDKLGSEWQQMMSDMRTLGDSEVEPYSDVRRNYVAAMEGSLMNTFVAMKRRPPSQQAQDLFENTRLETLNFLNRAAANAAGNPIELRRIRDAQRRLQNLEQSTLDLQSGGTNYGGGLGGYGGYYNGGFYNGGYGVGGIGAASDTPDADTSLNAELNFH